MLIKFTFLGGNISSWKLRYNTTNHTYTIINGEHHDIEIKFMCVCVCTPGLTFKKA